MSNQDLFDWLNEETSGLLLWVFLHESARDLAHASIPELVAQMRDLNSRKAQLRAKAAQCQELVEAKIQENETRVYEVIRLIEGNILDIQEGLLGRGEAAGIEDRCREAAERAAELVGEEVVQDESALLLSMQRDMALGLKSRQQLDLSKLDDNPGVLVMRRTLPKAGAPEIQQQPMDLSISSLNAGDGLRLFDQGPAPSIAKQEEPPKQAEKRKSLACCFALTRS